MARPLALMPKMRLETKHEPSTGAPRHLRHRRRPGNQPYLSMGAHTLGPYLSMGFPHCDTSHRFVKQIVASTSSKHIKPDIAKHIRLALVRLRDTSLTSTCMPIPATIKLTVSSSVIEVQSRKMHVFVQEGACSPRCLHRPNCQTGNFDRGR